MPDRWLKKWNTCKKCVREIFRENTEVKAIAVSIIAREVYNELKKYDTRISGSEMISSSNTLAEKISKELFE